jgi:hypothetical protein
MVLKPELSGALAEGGEVRFCEHRRGIAA